MAFQIGRRQPSGDTITCSTEEDVRAIRRRTGEGTASRIEEEADGRERIASKDDPERRPTLSISASLKAFITFAKPPASRARRGACGTLSR
jgi:hypothetical protein